MPVVRHVPNAASAVAVSDLSVGEFLSSDPGPEHDVLLEFVDQ
ncbi:hypothetical protein [Paraburkholderia franconis]|nr:hypothetical protein [Paraburkholderia franconis]